MNLADLLFLLFIKGRKCPMSEVAQYPSYGTFESLCGGRQRYGYQTLTERFQFKLTLILGTLDQLVKSTS